MLLYTWLLGVSADGIGRKVLSNMYRASPILISVMFVVSSDIMHSSDVFMLIGCFLYNDRYSSMFA